MTTIEDYKFYTDSKGTLLSSAEWEALESKRSSGNHTGELPEGWPAKLDGPLVWTGDELHQDETKFLYRLSEEDKLEIDNAIKEFGKDRNLAEVSKKSFPLPNLGSKLEDFSYKIYFGNGVRIIRGLEIDKYDRRNQILAYLGISSYIGDVRDAQGLNRAVTHIKSIAHLPREKRAPIAVSQQTTDPQMFHNDFGGDIVSLFVLDLPVKGGQSLVTSGYSIYNELASKRPDVIKTLAKIPGFLYRLSVEDDSDPLIHFVDGKLFTQFSTRAYIGYGETPRNDKYPELTEEQKDALGAYQWAGLQNSLIHTLEKGDIEYVNNLYLQHSRFGYVEDETHRRHVARLWLRNTELSKSIKKPKIVDLKLERYFPDTYRQEVPLDEFEEDDLKVKSGADTLEKIYSKPK